MDEYGREPEKVNNRVKVIGIIGGLIFFCVVGLCACVGGTVGVAFLAMQQSEPYQVAVERATGNRAVVTALGAPVEPSFFITGSINQDLEGGTAQFEIPLNGSNASGTIYVDAVMQNGVWVYNILEVETPTGWITLQE